MHILRGINQINYKNMITDYCFVLIMKRIVFALIILTLLILVPFGIQQLIQYRQLPSSITIATGKDGGRYKIIAEALGERVR